MATWWIAFEPWVQAQSVAVFTVINICLFRIYHAPDMVKSTVHADLMRAVIVPAFTVYNLVRKIDIKQLFEYFIWSLLGTVGDMKKNVSQIIQLQKFFKMVKCVFLISETYIPSVFFLFC